MLSRTQTFLTTGHAPHVAIRVASEGPERFRHLPEMASRSAVHGLRRHGTGLRSLRPQVRVRSGARRVSEMASEGRFLAVTAAMERSMPWHKMRHLLWPHLARRWKGVHPLPPNLHEPRMAEAFPRCGRARATGRRSARIRRRRRTAGGVRAFRRARPRLPQPQPDDRQVVPGRLRSLRLASPRPETGGAITTPILPGFTLDVREVFDMEL
jgi:hypothetical protein